MIIQCSTCGTKFRFDESKITSSGARLKCSKCNNVFIVKKPEDLLSDGISPKHHDATEVPPGPSLSQTSDSRPVEAVIKCPYCSKGIPKETHFCPHCGEDVTRKIAKKAETGELRCSSCQMINPHNSKFCQGCGKPLHKSSQPQIKDTLPLVCSQCGAPFPPGGKFCSKCGSKATKTSQDDQRAIDDVDRMKKMYESQGLDSGGEAGGTIFPFTAGWDDEFSGGPSKSGGEKRKRVITLIVIAGPGEGKEYTLDKKRTIIGRSDADIIIDDFKISRNHAEIEIIGPKFLLKDLDSTNGTFLNRSLTPADFLSQGDQIQIGDTIYRVSISEERSSD